MLTSAPQQPFSWYPNPEERLHNHRAYKISIGVLLIVVIGLGAIVGMVAIPRQFSPGLPRNPYSVVGQDFSYAWSGFKLYHPYLSITDVKGTWIIPSINCTGVSATQYASVWVGLDGVRNDTGTLEQIGIQSGCELANGIVSSNYDAFVEWYPAPPRIFDVPVRPGDKVTAEVSWSGNTFMAKIVDSTQGWTRSDVNSVIDRSAWRASAEWIVEAPSNDSGSIYPLANFDKVYFSNCFATTSDSSGPVGSYNLVQDTMLDSAGHPKARPFLPFWNDGTSFSVWWLAAGP